MTDVSAGFRPPCWCPCTWAPAWRLHTNLYKFGENVSSHIFHEKNCCDLNLGESLCICTFFLFPDSGLNLLSGLDFLFWSILNGVTLKTSNRYVRAQRECFLAVLVINRVSIMAILDLNRIWFLYFSLKLGMLFRISYFFIVIDKTINKSPSKIMFRATVSAATVKNRISNF